MNLSLITKNHAADPQIGFLTKSIRIDSDSCENAFELICKNFE